MKKLLAIFGALLITFALTGTAQAHVKLTSTMPSDGATLAKAPKMAMLHYNKAIRLVKINLKREDNKIALNYKASKKASKMQHISFPRLTAGQYDLAWTIMGNDGHKMKHRISFTVE